MLGLLAHVSGVNLQCFLDSIFQVVDTGLKLNIHDLSGCIISLRNYIYIPLNNWTCKYSSSPHPPPPTPPLF